KAWFLRAPTDQLPRSQTPVNNFYENSLSRTENFLIPPPKARERTAAVCGAPAAAARRGLAFSDNSATLGIRTCCGWSFGHSRDPVVVPRCARSGDEGGRFRDALFQPLR